MSLIVIVGRGRIAGNSGATFATGSVVCGLAPQLATKSKTHIRIARTCLQAHGPR
jgi:hypothetical protein